MEKLRQLWQVWKKVGQAIGDFIARIILTLFYFTIFVPFGLGSRLFSDPLQLKPTPKIVWQERTTKSPTLDDARRLF